MRSGPDVQLRLAVQHENPRELALTLARDSESLNQGFPTAALAVLRIAGTWDALAPGRAKLTNYQTPKLLNRDSDSDPD